MNKPRQNQPKSNNNKLIVFKIYFHFFKRDETIETFKVQLAQLTKQNKQLTDQRALDLVNLDKIPELEEQM